MKTRNILHGSLSSLVGLYMCALLNAFPNLFLSSRFGVNNPAGVQSTIAINWLFATDSPDFPRKLTEAGMVKMCGNDGKVTNKRFHEENWGILYTRDLPYSNIFLLSEYHLLYLEVNLMPYGFLLMIFTYSLFIISVRLPHSHQTHSLQCPSKRCIE